MHLVRMVRSQILALLFISVSIVGDETSGVGHKMFVVESRGEHVKSTKLASTLWRLSLRRNRALDMNASARWDWAW